MSAPEISAVAEPNEREASVVPRIYVASLADYNVGWLHGVWLDAAQDPEQLREGISAMLAASPRSNAEEWAIHDQDGFGPAMLDEYESMETVSALAQGIVAHGEAFAASASLHDQLTPETLGSFEEVYLGEWPNLEAYAEHLLHDLGAEEVVDAAPAWLRNYVRVDAAGFGRDLRLSCDIATVDSPNGVYVFGRLVR